MIDIKENLDALALPENVTLVAVSKFKPVQMLTEAYDAGIKDFGENYVQELVDKHEQLPDDINWHFIGHLQSNKVKYLAPFVHLIHSVDSFKLLKEINKQAAKNNRIQNCLLQVYIAEEDTKTGIEEAELRELLNSEEFKSFNNIKVLGLMGMSTFTDDEKQVRTEFNKLKTIFDSLKDNVTPNLELKIVSMGMSGDYEMAIEEGSNMVRIGSAIFGNRN